MSDEKLIYSLVFVGELLRTLNSAKDQPEARLTIHFKTQSTLLGCIFLFLCEVDHG